MKSYIVIKILLSDLKIELRKKNNMNGNMISVTLFKNIDFSYLAKVCISKTNNEIIEILMFIIILSK